MSLFTIHLHVQSTDSQMEKIMENIKSLNEKLDALEAAQSAERQEVLDTLKAIKALATQGDLDALGARLDAAISDAQDTITDADK